MMDEPSLILPSSPLTGFMMRYIRGSVASSSDEVDARSVPVSPGPESDALRSIASAGIAPDVVVASNISGVAESSSLATAATVGLEEVKSM